MDDNDESIAPAFTPYYDELVAHIEKCIGPVEPVLHEIISDVVHLDVLVVKPTATRPFYTLVTAGMSALPMNVPEGVPGGDLNQLAELIFTLPATNRYLSNDVEVDHDVDDDDDNSDYYPIGDLKMYARYPHLAETWIGLGHTLVSSDPPVPIAADTEMIGYLVSYPSVIASHQLWNFEASDGKRINLYQLYAIHSDELAFKLKTSGEDLIDRLLAADGLGPYDPKRQSTKPRKKFLGLF
jgi:hypothetical protein